MYLKNRILFNTVRITAISLFLLAINQQVYAQSDHYWSWNFNTMSMLMSGSVVGGNSDASAIFYNPSLISGVYESASLTLSASLISVQTYKSENIAGDGIDLKNTFVKVQPRFISYNYKTRNDRLNLEASVMTPVSEDIYYTLQHKDELELIQRTEGLENYSGYLRYSRKYDDLYLGLGGSYQLTEKLSVGSSLFISVKTLKYEYRQLAKAFQDSDTVYVEQLPEPMYIAESSFEEALKYWDLSLVLKLGAHYRLLNDQIGLGINLTFPNIPLFGKADVRKSLIRSNVYDNSEDQFTSDAAFIQVEEEARTRIKSPFSAAFGMSFATKSAKSTLSFTMEYFHKLDPYYLFDSDFTGVLPVPWPGTSGSSNPMAYSSQARALTNFALGFKQYISPSLNLMGGFRTDFTNGDGDNIRYTEDGFKINQVHVNKYHITLGPVIKLRKIQLVTGVQYTFGTNEDVLQAINYSDPIEYNPDTGYSLEGIRQNNSRIHISEISIFLGLTFTSD